MKINIELIHDSDENKKIIYPSQILDLLENDELIIRGPIKNTELVFLHRNAKIHISYNILDKGKHYFQAKLLSMQHTNIYALKIKKTSQIRNVQNREYYRLASTIPARKEFEQDKLNGIVHVEECEIKDISGGGIQLYSNYKHQTGDHITCFFTILNQQVSVICKVIRIIKIDNFNYKYSLGLSFFKIAENYRDIIIRYIFIQQRKLRSKGMI